jgi:hypothetical protein
MEQPEDGLNDAEWDFRPLVHKKLTIDQRQELSAAIRYEYARESQSLRKLAQEFAALSEHDQEEIGGLTFAKRGTLSLFAVLPFWNCILWPKFFPNTPWLLIPPEERLRRVQSYVATSPPTPYLEINERDDLREWELPKEGGRTFVGTVENLIVRINWAVANNEEIISSFATWVRTSRPTRIPDPRGDASRHNVTAAFLTRLAVMRLLHRYPHWKALDLARDRELKMPRQQSNALRMRGQVRIDLRKIFQTEVFESTGNPPLVPPDEVPRCFSTLAERQKKSRPREIRLGIGLSRGSPNLALYTDL